MREYIISKNEAGQRFDKYLKKNPRVKEALANGESNQAKKRLKAQSAAQR